MTAYFAAPKPGLSPLRRDGTSASARSKPGMGRLLARSRLSRRSKIPLARGFEIIASGPLRTSIDPSNSTARLSRCRHPPTTQHYQFANDGSTDGAAVRFPRRSIQDGLLRSLLRSFIDRFAFLRTGQSGGLKLLSCTLDQHSLVEDTDMNPLGSGDSKVETEPLIQGNEPPKQVYQIGVVGKLPLPKLP